MRIRKTNDAVQSFIRSIERTESIISGIIDSITKGRTTRKILDLSNVKEVEFYDGKYYCPHCKEKLDAVSTVICDKCWNTITWSCAHPSDEGIKNLVGAILENAVDDYRLATQGKSICPNDNRSTHLRKASVERFFKSSLFEMMCPNLNGEELFEKLKEERAKNKKERIGE